MTDVTDITLDDFSTNAGGCLPFLQARKEMASLSTGDRRACAVVCALDLVLHHHGAPEIVIDDLNTQVKSYLTGIDESTFVKRAKYLLCMPFAKYLKVELPPVPDMAFYFRKGPAKGWVKSRMCVNTQNTHLWYSFLQAKRACECLTADLVFETYEKHRKAMLVGDPIDDETHDLIMAQLGPILKKLRLELHAAKTRFYEEGGDFEHVGSTSACYEQSRRFGGSILRLQEVAGVGLFRERDDPKSAFGRNPDYFVRPELVSMQFYTRCVKNGRIVTNHVQEVYGYPTAVSTIWTPKLMDLALKSEGPLRCTIQAVLEPLKVRVISKGEAVPYYVAKPVQKALHTAMRRMDCFRLIGRPLDAGDLKGLIRKGAAGGTGPLEWFSIDYSAATDNLSARLSSSIMNSLLSDFPLEVRNMLLQVLAPHRVEYPVLPGKPEIEPCQQQNGQLMGSILSFPILCLANLGLYLAVTRDDERPLAERMSGVLVNGDDMLYCARTSRWADHVAMGKKVGLEMSVGKAYHHPTVANANSMCFHYEITRAGSQPRYVPYLNAGLYFGQGKVQGGDDVSDTRNHISVIPTLLEGIRESRKNLYLGQYLKYHADDLRRETKVQCGRTVITANIFLEESVGGFGVVAPKGFDYKVTKAQRQLAATIFRHNPYLRYRLDMDENPDHEILEQDFESVDDSPSAPWLAPSKVKEMRRFPDLLECYTSNKRVRRGFIQTGTPRERSGLDVLREEESTTLREIDYTRLEEDFLQCDKHRKWSNLVQYSEMQQIIDDPVPSLKRDALRTLWRQHLDTWSHKLSKQWSTVFDEMTKFTFSDEYQGVLSDQGNAAQSDFLIEKWNATIGKSIPIWSRFDRVFSSTELFMILTEKYGYDKKQFLYPVDDRFRLV